MNKKFHIFVDSFRGCSNTTLNSENRILGFELGNRTKTSYYLGNAKSAEKVQQEVGGLAKFVDEYLGVEPNIITFHLEATNNVIDNKLSNSSNVFSNMLKALYLLPKAKKDILFIRARVAETAIRIISFLRL